tara:strand:+ start:953 stop:1513 length:561 start_codon:yes stop_codon:yes gene_type:complete
MIKLTAGKYKNKKLDTISQFVRPTSSIKREAFFSIIESYAFKNSIDIYNKKIFLDLFAGIGSMGLEAISRGIDSAIFFENELEVIKVLKKNCQAICHKEQYIIKSEDVLISEFNINFKNISVIYIDPPYNKYDLDNLLTILQNKISKKTIIGIESSIKDNFKIPSKLNLIKQKEYGKTKLSILNLF